MLFPSTMARSSQNIIAVMTSVGCGCLFAHAAHIKLSFHGKAGLFLSPKTLAGVLLDTPPPFYARAQSDSSKILRQKPLRYPKRHNVPVWNGSFICGRRSSIRLINSPIG
jgi:hypothetical protein